MNKKLIFCLIAIIATSIILISCSPNEPEKPQLTVQPTFFTFTKNVNSDILVISNSGGGELSWKITDKPEWLEVSKNNGIVKANNDTVIVTADVNQNAGNQNNWRRSG